MKLALILALTLLSAPSHAAKENPTADDFIRRIDERTAMVKQRMQSRGGGQSGQAGQAKRQGRGQGEGRRAGRGGRGGPGGRGGGGPGRIAERLNKRDQRIEQRLASSNLSEEEKQRVRAKMQSSRKELEALASQHREQHQGKRGGRKQSRE